MNISRVETSDHELLESAGGYLRQYGRNVRRWIENGLVIPDTYDDDNCERPGSKRKPK